MLETITQGFRNARHKLQGKAELTEDNITEALRDVRVSLLEGDVEFGVVKTFLKRVEDEIKLRQAETRHALAEDTVTLTAQIARELLEREMTDDDRRRYFERSLEAMTDLRGRE